MTDYDDATSKLLNWALSQVERACEPEPRVSYVRPDEVEEYAERQYRGDGGEFDSVYGGAKRL